MTDNHSIEPLAETLPLRDDETAASLASRLAAMNGAGNAREFCRDFFLDFERIAAGDPHEIRRFSIFAAADYDRLMRTATTRIGRSMYINQERITISRSHHTRMRMCVECAKKDIADAPHLMPDAAIACRLDSLVGVIRTCYRHGMSYVQISDQSSMGEHVGDYTVAVADALEEMSIYTEAAVERPASEAELYFLGRIGLLGRRQVHLLDALDLEAAARLCQFFGVYALRGPTGRINRLNDDELYEATQAGFSVVDAGARGIHRMIRDEHAKVASPNRDVAPAMILGNLRYCLQASSGAHLDDVRQIVIDAISMLVPLGPDDPALFGVKPAKRHWHNLSSASREYGLPPRTILGDLKRLGLTEPAGGARGRRHKVRVAVLDDLYRSPAASIPQHRVFELTGIKGRFLPAFEAVGLLVPVRSATGKRNSAFFRQGQVDEMLRRFAMLAPESDEAEAPGMVNLVDAYLESHWSLAEVLSAIISGQVPTLRICGHPLFHALRINLEALRAAHPFFGADVMSVQEVADLLVVSANAISRLANLGELPFHRTRAPRFGKLGRSILRSDALPSETATSQPRKFGGPAFLC